MSCRASIRRKRLLIPGRSTSLVPSSQVNPRIGYKGQRRNFEEFLVYVNSADRDPVDTSSSFTVKIPDGPVFPINSRIQVQVFAASIPNTFYYLQNEYVEVSVYKDIPSIVANAKPERDIKRWLNGTYDPQNDTDLAVMSTSSTSGFDLFFDRRTKHFMNRNKDKWIKIKVSSAAGRLAYGFPDEIIRSQISSYFSGVISSLGQNTIIAQLATILSDENVMLLAPNPDIDFVGSSNEALSNSANLRKTTIVQQDSNGTKIFEKTLPFTMAIAPRPSIFIPLCYYINMDCSFENVFETTDMDARKISNCTQSQTLCMIPVTSDFYSVLTYMNDINMYQEFTNRQDFKQFRITITDENGIEVSPNLDWSLGIRIRWEPEDHFAR